MTQQPFGQGFGQPQQQGYQQGAPQGYQQGGPQQGQPDPAPQVPVNQNESGTFFGGMGGTGEVIPSFKFGGVGSAVEGQILSASVMDVTIYGTSTLVVDQRTGENAKQLKIVLQTQHRNWEHVAKVPTDENGNMLPPTADDGRRAIYTGGKSSKGQSWMSGAINDALREAGRDPAKGLEIGAMLGVAVTEEVPTNQGNPYKKYAAKYASPSQGGFQQAPQQPQAAPQVQPAPSTYNPQQAEQTGYGFNQQPQGQPDAFQGYQPPQQPAPQPQQPSQGNPWGSNPQGTPPF